MNIKDNTSRTAGSALEDRILPICMEKYLQPAAVSKIKQLKMSLPEDGAEMSRRM
jgi:hypothetical protein